MGATLSGYLHSVSNPVGRFKALEGVFPIRDVDGVPMFSVHSRSVNFRVEWRGTQYVMKCLTDHSVEVRNGIKLIYSMLESARSPHCPECGYYEGEIAVQGSTGSVVCYDVVMQRVDDGTPLGDYVSQCCRADSADMLRALLRGLVDMSRWLDAKRLAHCNIKPSNIQISRAGCPMLLNFDFACRIPSPGDSAGQQADNTSLAGLCLALGLVICDPAIYLNNPGYDIFSPQAARALAGAVTSSDAIAADHPLKNIGSIIASQQPISRAELCLCLDRLRAAELCATMLPDELKAACGNLPGHRVRSKKPDMSSYRSAEDAGETFLRGQAHDGRWHYVDHAGNRVCNRGWDMAGDFSEGRAVVTHDGLSNVIDTRGTLLMDRWYQAVEWDGRVGIAAVMAGGKWGLCGRDGEPLTEVIYDWLSEFNEDMLLARLNNKYGYLDRAGRERIEFRFDEASSFSSGRAPVRIGQRKFYVDTNGREIEGTERIVSKLR